MRSLKFLTETVCFWVLTWPFWIFPASVAFRLGDLIAWGLWKVGIRRRVVNENLQRAFPHTTKQELRELKKRLYAHTMETFVAFTRNDKTWESNLDVIGEEHLFNTWRAGKGTIILLGHLGNWEMMGRKFAGYPFSCHVVAKPMENPLFERYVLRRREQSGLHVIYAKNAIVEIVRVLRKNGFVGILADQDAGRQGIFVPFFGEEASTVPSVASLALKYGCTVLMVHLLHEESGKWSFRVSPPLPLIQSGDRVQDVHANTARYTKELENVIRKYPDQYFGWFHRRWKTRPLDEISQDVKAVA